MSPPPEIPCAQVSGPVAVLAGPHGVPVAGEAKDGLLLADAGLLVAAEILWYRAPGRSLVRVEGSWSGNQFRCRSASKGHAVTESDVVASGAWVVGCGAVSAVVEGRAHHPILATPCFLQTLGADGTAGTALRIDATLPEPVELTSPKAMPQLPDCLQVTEQRVVVGPSCAQRVTPWARPGDQLTSIDGVDVAFIGDVEALLWSLRFDGSYGVHWVRGIRDGAAWADRWENRRVIYDGGEGTGPDTLP